MWAGVRRHWTRFMRIGGENGLEEKKVNCGAKEGLPWFTKDLRRLWKECHQVALVVEVHRAA